MNETVNVLRDQVAQLTRERDDARRVAAVHVTDNIEMGEDNNRLTAERDEWRALATKAQDERDQWMSKAGELTEEVAELREAVDSKQKKLERAHAERDSANALLEEARDAIDEACWPVWWEKWRAYLSGTSDTNPRI